MRAELEGMLRGRYGEDVLRSVVVVELTKKHLDDYTRHHGLVNFWIDLYRNPHLVVVDTGNLIHLRHAWVGRHQRDAFRLVLSSGIQPVAEHRLRTHTYSQRVEALELSIHWGHWHRKDVPYIEELKPLW